jgi:hypothetical protein
MEVFNRVLARTRPRKLVKPAVSASFGKDVVPQILVIGSINQVA